MELGRKMRYEKGGGRNCESGLDEYDHFPLLEMCGKGTNQNRNAYSGGGTEKFSDALKIIKNMQEYAAVCGRVPAQEYRYGILLVHLLGQGLPRVILGEPVAGIELK